MTDTTDDVDGAHGFRHGYASTVSPVHVCLHGQASSARRSNPTRTAISAKVLGGSWTFTPAEVAEGADPHMVAGVIPDPDYLTFGQWRRDTVGADGTESGISAFAMGNDRCTMLRLRARRSMQVRRRARI